MLMIMNCLRFEQIPRGQSIGVPRGLNNYTRPPPSSDGHFPPPAAHSNHRCMGACAVPPNVPHAGPCQPPRAHQHSQSYAYSPAPAHYMTPSPVLQPMVLDNRVWRGWNEAGAAPVGAVAPPSTPTTMWPHAPPPPATHNVPHWDAMSYRRPPRDHGLPIVPPSVPPPPLQYVAPPPAHSNCQVHGAGGARQLQGDHTYGHTSHQLPATHCKYVLCASAEVAATWGDFASVGVVG